MNDSTVLIVEDEIIIAELLKDYLETIGIHNIYMAHTKEQAIESILNINPDLILLDIRLKNHSDGIEIAQMIDEKGYPPYIFITSNSDQLFIQKAIHTKAMGYISKPLKEADFSFAVLNALKTIPENTHKSFLIKENNINIKIPLKDILYIESSGNYIFIHTQNKKTLARQSLEWAEEQLPPKLFMRIHRSFIVNVSLVERTTSKTLFIKSLEIPVSRTYMPKLVEYLKLN